MLPKGLRHPFGQGLQGLRGLLGEEELGDLLKGLGGRGGAVLNDGGGRGHGVYEEPRPQDLLGEEGPGV